MADPGKHDDQPDRSAKQPNASRRDNSVLRQIEARTGTRPAVDLRDAEPAGQTPMLRPLAPDDGIARETGKYLVHGLLGQGGVGAVHKGHDTDLGRDVALKFLLAEHREHPDMLHRFIEEAQIGGQLQHPGIVPVYELGIADGRPFFSMKMVKGQTLAQRLAERESPAANRGTFLGIFEDICQTMAYAHARGVVHRDLKPANIMIGAFGEVQVVDWGMGKVLPRGGVADEQRAASRQAPVSVVETVRSGSGTHSVTGSVMGTPAYMPPEQARGDVEAMDTRSDVFALGAILCEILTGKPPYVSESNQLLVLAANAKLADAYARLLNCGAEQDLIELATKCLMPAQAARPASAEAVAKAIHQHLTAAEARTQAARIETAAAQERESSLRRSQRLGIALTAVIAAGLAVSLWFWREADTQRRNAEAAAKAAKTAELAALAAEGRERTAREAAETNLANFDRLSHVVRLNTAKASATALHPAWPKNATKLRAWLDRDARELQAALPELRATLTALAYRTQSQDNPADLFLRDTLQTLVADIEAFAGNEVPSVKQRLIWAERVEQLTIERHRDRWNEARLAILAADGRVASALYSGERIELQPQLGLVPIGMNPQSKLWEFYHLRSAWNPDEQSDPAAIEIPTPNASGRFDMEGRGIVFVLIPGGRFWMGAQRDDQRDRNFDRYAGDEEGPVHEVQLAPYFLAKHELTQGQWARLAGGAYPSWFKVGQTYPGLPNAVSDSHPVEQVSWIMGNELLARYALELPTEAQWENACRAGTSTPWFTGREPGSLEGFANVLDQTGARVPPAWPGGESFDDGHKGPARVGTFAPNVFGLHDMHGNVSEWCRDWYGVYSSATRPGDGLRKVRSAQNARVNRGGDYPNAARRARSAYRNLNAPTIRYDNLGVRPARAIAP